MQVYYQLLPKYRCDNFAFVSTFKPVQACYSSDRYSKIVNEVPPKKYRVSPFYVVRKLSAWRRTIVRLPPDDRSPPSGRSFTGRRTTNGCYTKIQTIPKKRLTYIKKKRNILFPVVPLAALRKSQYLCELSIYNKEYDKTLTAERHR